MAQGNLHAVDAINSGIAGRRAAQSRHMRIGYKAHMHQVVLDRFGQIQGDQNPAFANLQLA